MNDSYFKWLMDSMELKKALLERLKQIKLNLYGLADAIKIDRYKIFNWIYFHTRSVDYSHMDITMQQVHEILDAAGIFIIQRDNKYIVIMKPLEFVTLPLYQRYKTKRQK